MDAGLERRHRRLGRHLFTVRVSFAKQIHHLAAHFPVFIPVEFDVSVKVVAQRAELAGKVLFDTDKPLANGLS